VAVGLSHLLNNRSLYLTGTKALQQQLYDDFSDVIFDIRGRSNYHCRALDIDGELKSHRPLTASPGKTYNCGHGPCKVNITCSLKNSGCDYYSARYKASSLQHISSNYAFHMSIGRFSPNSLGKFDLMILDEAHGCLDWLTDFCTVTFNDAKVDELIGMSCPQPTDTLLTWQSWCTAARPATIDAYRNAKGNAALQISITNLGSGMRMISDSITTNNRWIIKPTKSGTELCPVWPGEYAERYLFQGVNKILLMSGTLTPQTATDLGIIKKDYTYIELKGGFDRRRTPVTYISESPSIKVHYRMKDNDKDMLVDRIDRIIDLSDGERGIIHSVSYNRSAEIVSRTRHSDILIDHKSGSPTFGPSYLSIAVDEYLSDTPRNWIISPVLKEGYDFPDDMCRWIIIPKVPLLPPSDLIDARKLRDKKYAYRLAAQAIIQMSLRGMRSESDYCHVFILDSQWINWFRESTPMSKWFKRMWEKDNVIRINPYIQKLKAGTV